MPVKPAHRKDAWNDILKNGVGAFFDTVFSGFYSSLNRETDYLIDRIEARAFGLHQKFLWNVAWMVAVGLSAGFFVLSVYFYMTEMQGMSKTAAFLILAAVLFAAGIIIKKNDGRDYNESKN